MSQNWLIGIIPLLTGFLSSIFFSINADTGKNIKARPPAFIFPIVWTILYIFMGIVWVKTRKEYNTDLLFITLTFFLILWVATYNKNKKLALYIILICILLTLMILITIIKNKNMSLLLSPLLVWLFFATLLNYDSL